jgi:hypothetical protein
MRCFSMRRCFREARSVLSARTIADSSRVAMRAPALTPSSKNRYMRQLGQPPPLLSYDYDFDHRAGKTLR